MHKKIIETSPEIIRNKHITKYLNLLKKHHYESYEHSLRVGFLCIYLGMKNSLDQEKIKLLGYAGFLHDIGKLDIPLSILSKKTSLNEKEIKKMREHPRHSFLRIKEPELQEVRQLIIMHHEYCHCPYPRKGGDRRGKKRGERRQTNGLKNLAQILSVADMYDALSHKRSYHEPLGCKEIEKIMREQFKGKKKYINQVIEKYLIDHNTNIMKD